MTSAHTAPWPATAIRPTREHIKPGDWLVLRNGWVVGPVTALGADDEYMRVVDGNYRWPVHTIDQPDVTIDPTRFVLFAGSLQHACMYRQRIEQAHG